MQGQSSAIFVGQLCRAAGGGCAIPSHNLYVYKQLNYVGNVFILEAICAELGCDAITRSPPTSRYGCADSQNCPVFKTPSTHERFYPPPRFVSLQSQRDREQDQKQLRIMQKREHEDAVRRSAMPVGGSHSYNRTTGATAGASPGAFATSVNSFGDGGEADTAIGGSGGISEAELFAPLRVGLPPTDAPVAIPTVRGNGAGAGRKGLHGEGEAVGFRDSRRGNGEGNKRERSDQKLGPGMVSGQDIGGNRGTSGRGAREGRGEYRGGGGGRGRGGGSFRGRGGGRGGGRGRS